MDHCDTQTLREICIADVAFELDLHPLLLNMFIHKTTMYNFERKKLIYLRDGFMLRKGHQMIDVYGSIVARLYVYLFLLM